MSKQKAIITNFEQAWEEEIMAKGIIPLENALDFLASGNGIDNKVYIQIYSVCYDLCIQRDPYNYSKDLYDKHREIMCNFLNRKFNDIMNIKQFINYYELYLIMNKWLNNFMMYLNRFYIKVNNLPNLYDSGCNYFKLNVYNVKRNYLFEMINEIINNYRDGNSIDILIIKNFLSILDDIDKTLYTSDFVPVFLEGLTNYYRKKSSELLETNIIEEYISLVHQNIDREWNLINNNFKGLTKEKSLKILYDTFIKGNSEKLLDAFNKYCSVDDYAHINMTYLLFLYIEEGPKLMANSIEELIIKMCELHLSDMKIKISNEELKPPQKALIIETYLDDLIRVLDKMNLIVENYCENSNAIKLAIQRAFTYILNKEESKFKYEEILSQYANNMLSTLKIHDVDNHSKKIIYLANCFKNKDVFEENYRNIFTKRFFNQKISNIDHEKFFIQHLRVTIGVTFTVKLNGILHDIMQCKDNVDGFSLITSEKKLLENEVKVLTATYWTSVIKPTVKLPESLDKIVTEFKQYYSSKNSNRKVDFIYSQGFIIIKAVFNKISYELTVNTLQGIVLNAFNTKSAYTLSELFEFTGIQEDMLKKILASLFMNEKYKLLLKNGETFTVNDKFKPPTRKLTIPMVSLEENKENAAKLNDDRNIMLDAALVRIMKSRKVLNFIDIVFEVQRQVTFFKPENASIKKRIESLIEREYLERDDEDYNRFKYLA